jgi:hypothetical protein
MGNISLTLYTNLFLGSVLKSPTQMGSLSVNNSQISHAWAPLTPAKAKLLSCLYVLVNIRERLYFFHSNIHIMQS